MGRGRNQELDGLRGLAALAVAIFHSILVLDHGLLANDRLLLNPIWTISGWHDLIAAAILIIFNGETAVMLFFCISGAVLAAALEREPSFDLGTVWRFTARRILRIYPALIVCLVIFFALNHGLHAIAPSVYDGPTFTWGMLFSNMALVDMPMHGASWTLQAEILAVPFILLAAGMTRAWGSLALIPYCLGATLLLDNLIPGVRLPFFQPVLLAFMFGVAISRPEARRLFQDAPRWGWVAGLIGTMLVLHIVPHASISAQVCHAAFAACTVACIYYGHDSSVLTRPFVLTLGRISYSFYLYAVVSLVVIIRPFLWALGAQEAFSHWLEYGLLLSLLTVAGAIPVARWSERWIEQPFISLGHRLAGKARISSGTAVVVR